MSSIYQKAVLHAEDDGISDQPDCAPRSTTLVMILKELKKNPALKDIADSVERALKGNSNDSS